MISEENIFKHIAKTKNTIVVHPSYQKASEQIEKALRAKIAANVSKNILCLGDPGTGKTTLKNHLKVKYPPMNDSVCIAQPLVCVETPSKPTVKSMAETILVELDDPNFYRGTATQKTNRIKDLFREKKVMMLIVDELQHFVDHCGPSTAKEVSDWLKSLMEDSKVCFVLMGLKRSITLLSINTQLQRRFSQKVYLPPFSITDPESTKIFGGVILQLEQSLATKSPLALTEDLVKRFYFATMGIIDYVTKILITAYEIAMDMGHEGITSETLELAFNEAIWQECKRSKNPFSNTFTWEFLDKPNMPFHDAVERDSMRQTKGGFK
ncbi:TniB protein [Alteromonas macleodii]|nr:TniB protein [Alteromonas macleodii]VTP51285.1 TniB protein [Alteromonas macleodii]